MNTNSSLIALRNAVKQRLYKDFDLIHHSDRGLQYCSNEYQKLLIKNHIKCSMTQNSDPYENAIAERINGILKQEFDIDKHNQSLDKMKIIVRNAIEIYNNIRPHYSNHMLTPQKMHLQSQIKIRTYKSKISTKNKF